MEKRKKKKREQGEGPLIEQKCREVRLLERVVLVVFERVMLMLT